MYSVLIVEDDYQLNRTVCKYLQQRGYATVGCLSADEAYDVMYKNSFDIIVSDVMMPKIDGYEFAKTVRQIDQEIPILFMTARDDLSSKQQGFNVGIDDYMVKPIELDELYMRIGALLRRSNIKQSKKLSLGQLLLDSEEHTAYVGEDEVALTVREFKILHKLLSYPKKTFTRAQLMDEFWDYDSSSSPRTVDVYITKLRDKFSRCYDFEIITVHGLGYKAVIK